MVLFSEKMETSFRKCFLNECKYIGKERKVVRYITEDLQMSSDDSDDSMKNEINKQHDGVLFKKVNFCPQKYKSFVMQTERM